ncbi:MAG: hypothetical protein E7169_04670 [Firmicutes bacterium]|nr:hypothetical protein [Bacillota bacterium]
MKRKFKFRRKKILKKMKTLGLILLVVESFLFTYNYLKYIKLYSSNEEFIMLLLNNSNHHLKYEKTSDFSSKVISFFTNINIKNPISLLEKSFNYNMGETSELVYSDEYNPDSLNSSYINDPNPKEIEKPLVYIYNSHQLENYSSENYEAYNITPNVMMASYLLREKLNDLGIKTIVEEADITEFIRINNWNYNYSYVASRYYIEDAIKQNPSLNFFIDLHRDALSKDASTVTINDKKYAKVLFVVGLEHDNYQKNLDLANKINNMVMDNYPYLSRGVITKKGANVDGIYNQDIHPNMILLELGGNENTIDEVLNTVEAMAIILKEHLNEK